MNRISFSLVCSLGLLIVNNLQAQDKPTSTQNQSINLRNAQAVAFGVQDQRMIDMMMPFVKGVGRANSLDNLREQSVKPFMMPVREIEQVGTEMSYTLAACLEFYFNQDNNYKINLSPDFITLNLLGQNRALQFKDAFQFLSQNGTVDSAILPYGSQKLTNAVYNASKFRITNYLHVFTPLTKSLQKIFELRKALVRGNPVIVEFNADPSLVQANGKDTWIPTGAPSQVYPMAVVSFNEDKRMIELMSPWGSDWGRAGYIWISYEHFGQLAQNGFVVLPVGQ
ncbi:hypothetical protein [Haliscomenobacter sp.]|uniref:hypothetical protein n=1 Tax=Haliscomenobacter sp. TaxID=2717303 RepID=UPI0035941448